MDETTKQNLLRLQGQISALGMYVDELANRIPDRDGAILASARSIIRVADALSATELEDRQSLATGMREYLQTLSAAIE